MGNSESFDLVTFPEQNNQQNQQNKKNQKKQKQKNSNNKKPSHHQHSQTITSSLKTITSFDLNGIFRKISEENNEHYPEKKIDTNELIATAPPPDSEIITEPSETSDSRPSSRTESSESDCSYVEQKMQEVERMSVLEKEFVSVTLTKCVENSPEIAPTEAKPYEQNEESDSSETIQQTSEEVEVVIVKEIENEDIINLDKDEIEMEQQEKNGEETSEPNKDEENNEITADTLEYESEVKIVIKTEELEVEEETSDEKRCTI
jgi:hypothetical protein